MEDEEAVRRSQQGDHDAYRVLVERYESRVYALCMRILRNPEQARDATQDAFIKAYGAIRRFEGRSSFYTWMYRLTFNLCLDIKRADKSKRHVDVDWQAERGVANELAERPKGGIGPGNLPTPDGMFERRQLQGLLAEAIEALPEDARQTLLLREVEGRSYAEIAEELGIPKGTVMSRLHYARKRAREFLMEAGVESPGGPPKVKARGKRKKSAAGDDASSEPTGEEAT